MKIDIHTHTKKCKAGDAATREISWGGDDDLENMVLVCPNHHAASHRDDAAFDYGDLTFRYSNGLWERLKANEHLPAA